jgi:lipoate-protein ligase A
MNLATKSLVFNLLIFLFLINFLDAYSRNKNTYLKSKSNKKVLNLLADKFIEYFDLENKLIADNYFENVENKLINENEYEKCQNAEKINDYFFEVYSEENNKLNITADDLESLIMHQIQKRYLNS